MYKTDEQRITEFYESLDTSQSEGQEIDMQDEEFDWDEDFGAYEASKAEAGFYLDILLEEENE